MLIKFKCKVDEIGLTPFYIWMKQVPFNTDKPQYYVAVLGNKDNVIIEEFCNEDPKQCLLEIKLYLTNLNYHPLEVTVENILEPNYLFSNYISNIIIKG
jgi:hypothetical protein